MEKLSVVTNDFARSNAKLFANTLREISSALKKWEVNTIPYNHESCEYFRSLPCEAARIVANGAESTLASIQKAEKLNVPLVDRSHSILWWALKEMHMIPRSDVFALLEENDVVEVYNGQSIQVFRTFNLFRYLSYTLEELMCFEWFRLFERDDEITRSMLKVGDDILSGKVMRTHFPNFPSHYVTEKFSATRMRTLVQHRFISPLSDGGGGIAGFLNVVSVVKNSQTCGVEEKAKIAEV